MNPFGPYKNRACTFTVKNITSDGRKTIKVFGQAIPYNTTFDLLTIDGIGEGEIRISLLKGELYHKIAAGDLIVVASDIDLTQFNDSQKQFLQAAGVINGIYGGTGPTGPQGPTGATGSGGGGTVPITISIQAWGTS